MCLVDSFTCLTVRITIACCFHPSSLHPPPGPVTGSVEGAWLREEAMFLGVGIYLVVDNAILPFRTDRALRVGFVHCTEEARAVLAEARQALAALVHADFNPTLNPNPNLNPDPDRSPWRARLAAPTPSPYPLDFPLCLARLDACDAAVSRLAALVAKQGVGLKAVVHEPVILGAPFPVTEYAALLGQFVKVG